MPTESSFEFRHSSFAPRIGHGYDLHRLEPGLALVIGGLRFEHDRGCDAHSDGDVVYHALTDAILGALGEDDIGTLFPNDDPKWKSADSQVFVDEAMNRARRAGFAIGNVDITVILQAPKLRPRRPAMREHLAGVLGCELDQVNIKGKTHEHVDAVGQGRAIECHVVVLLIKR